MNLLVLGAAGSTGRQIVSQALSRGHQVTAFVRRPEAMTSTATQVRVVVGDITRDESRLAEAMSGQDVVISALGRGNSFRSQHLISGAMRSVVPAMEGAAVQRLILMSAFGTGESLRDAPPIPRIMYRLLLKDILADKHAAEEFVRASGLSWTIVYPVLLTNGPLTGRYRAGERLELHGLPKISRADVAQFIVNEAESRAFVQKVAVISD